MMRDRFARILRAAIDVAAVGAAVVFTASYFPREVMFSPTITNGGDMGSHYYPGARTCATLLPKGAVTGWCPGNYCGYPVFQFYFPLPFLLIARLSLVVPSPWRSSRHRPRHVPACRSARTSGCGCSARRSRPGPRRARDAVFTFMEANTMWGGNIPSTLAGEFSLSLGLRSRCSSSGPSTAPPRGPRLRVDRALGALIGVSHGYTLLWAGFARLMELVTSRGWWRRVARAHRDPRPRDPADGVLALPAARLRGHGPRRTRTSGRR